ncbi:unnamed protein product [Clonostachys rhizophaga]|uniref:NADH-cytochrome b5 reductase n=1 Tax=Clonostachys rhizophaga TaxID=160324 RepID=A0A9N9YR45_9HYPO|nr:unnamed protein product [Clonostachys rhizophaga]
MSGAGNNMSAFIACLVVTAVLLLTKYGLIPAKRKGVLKPDQFQDFILQKKIAISHNVAIYRFQLPAPDSILGLPIGQHISIGADIKQPDGSTKEIVRSYTPITGDDQPGHFDVLLKTYPQGNISHYMASLPIGQSIKVRGPKGAFNYTPNMVRRFGMIAGGTGITPMLQILNAIARGRATGDKTEAHLVFANGAADDILLKKELEQLAQDPKIHVHYVLNQPPKNWKGGIGFITETMIKEWLPAPSVDVKILLCGPPPMVAAMKKATQAIGFEKSSPVGKMTDQVFSF